MGRRYLESWPLGLHLRWPERPLRGPGYESATTCATAWLGGRYSAGVADPSPNALARAALPWVVATAVVLAAAVTTGFLVAYLVASGRAVDAPGVGLASPTPRRMPIVSLAPGQTPNVESSPTIQPRRTPTPVPVITPEPSPFVHVIARLETLRYIAGIYCTTVDAIVELNGITNPNRIQVGQELLIPGGGCATPSPSP